MAGSVDQTLNRNRLIETFTGEWLAMVDDDQVYRPDLMLRLLQHLSDPAVDIVVPLILRKVPPHDPVLAFSPTDKTPPGTLPQVRLEASDRGLLEVYAAGSGIMLIRRRVFDRVASPWFERHPAWGHDYHFCMKATAAGCRIFCDIDTRAAHIMSVIVWPVRAADGTFGTGFSNLDLGDEAATVGTVQRAYASTDQRP